MQETTNLKLKKPDLTDYVNVGDLNENAEKIDAAVTENKEDLAAHLAEKASLTTEGHVQLSDVTNSTSKVLAATPSAVKEAMDRADAAFTSASNGKQTVGNAITGVDDSVVIPTNPTYEQLADAIGQISTGFKIESGEVAILGDVLEVTELDFAPEYVFLTIKTPDPNNHMALIYVNKKLMPYYVNSSVRYALAFFSRRWSNSNSLDAYVTDDVSVNMTSNGFYLPITGTSTITSFRGKTYEWIAFGR